MSITYRRLPLHARLPAPMRRAFISRGTLSPASRLEIWESEGGALKSIPLPLLALSAIASPGRKP